MHKLKKIILSVILLSSIVFQTALAAGGSFVIKKIDVQGLQRISEGTVYSYLPLKEGETFVPVDSAKVITALYETGFFSNVDLLRDGDTLIVKVVERPVIGKIQVTGNKDLSKDNLMPALKDIGLVEGHVYDRSMLDSIEKSLQEQYFARGKYNARVDVNVEPQERNRVDVAITISEGRVAVIKEINIVGNNSFDTKELKKNLTLSTSSLFSFFTHSDQYSKPKLDASLENLLSFYMDRGYIKFHVDSAQVSITPDRLHVYITINVTEGPQYTVKGYSLVGELILPEDQLKSLVTLKEGDVFSRKDILETNKALVSELGDHGYYYAHVGTTPTIDDEAKTVFINFDVQPGRLIYVRRINFFGDDRTNDSVLRRAMRQLEGGLLRTKNLTQSRWRMQQLTYIKAVNHSVERVPGENNQVDVQYQVTETPAASLNASIGYSQLDGIILSASVQQNNFIGTGNAVSLAFTRSKGYQNYALSYFNPYYTQEGVSRRISVYLHDTDPGHVNIGGSYTLTQFGTDISYGIPISEGIGSQSNVSFGYGLSRTIMKLSTTQVPSTEVQDFVDKYGRAFHNIHLDAGWTYNGLNRAVFPTKGFRQSIGSSVFLPADSNSIGYYKLAYSNVVFQPVTEHNILTAKASVGFGDSFIKSSELPFFANYYAGGPGSVRGYEGNTLGPLDSNGDPKGGNFTLSGSLGWIFPSPLNPDSVRTMAFIDAGTVYSTYADRDDGGVNLSKMRFGAGFEIDWLSPMGPINFSYAWALNPSKSDNLQNFDFSIGTSF